VQLSVNLERILRQRKSLCKPDLEIASRNTTQTVNPLKEQLVQSTTETGIMIHRHKEVLPLNGG